jgi:hypothetical protein
VAAAEVVERYGMVWACVESPAPELPRWPEGDDPRFRVYVEFWEEWRAAAPRIIDNTLDRTHPTFVHRGTFGDPGRPMIEPYSFEPTPTGFVTRSVQEVPGVGLQNGAGTDERTRTYTRTNEAELLAPLTTRVRFFFEQGCDYSFFGSAVPVDDERSIYMRLSALAGSDAEQPYEDFHRFGTRVKEEDRVVLEQTDPEFSLDITDEVHLKVDRVTLEYRKYLSACRAGRRALAAPAEVPSR